MKHRIYVAGPYTADTPEGVEANVRRAALITLMLMRKGHTAFCPHTHSHMISEMSRDLKCWMTHEQWMQQDFPYIDHWATALFFIDPSRGADMELLRAQRRELVIFHSLDEVPHGEEEDKQEGGVEEDIPWEIDHSLLNSEAEVPPGPRYQRREGDGRELHPSG